MTQRSDSPLSGGVEPVSGGYPEGSPNPTWGGERSTTDVAKDQAGEVAKRRATPENTSPTWRASRPGRWPPKRRNRSSNWCSKPEASSPTKLLASRNG